MKSGLKILGMSCLIAAAAVNATSIQPAFSQTTSLSSYQLAVKAAIDLSGALAEDELSEAQLSGIERFYASSAYTPIWTDNLGVNFRGRQLEAILSRSYRHGFPTGNYSLAALQLRLDSRDPAELARLELDMSRAFVAYAHDLAAGRIDPETVNRSIYLDPRAPTATRVLLNAATKSSIVAYARELEPDTPRYRRMMVALDQYRHQSANGGWIQVPRGKVIKPGDDDPRVSALRIRLTASGDMPPGHHIGTVYDSFVEAGVKKFQARHGLAEDGILGPNTMKEINVPVIDRIAQMELNLERRRWLKDDLGDRFVFVNLADQHLTLIENGKPAWKSPVVIGKPYHATPVFTEKMEYLVMNPNWNIPKSIATKEMLPKLRRNPGALARQNISVRTGWSSNSKTIDPYSVNWRYVSSSDFPFRLQQGPGSNNALGRVKFMFPNRHNIYIHDTPAKNLFSRTSRTFSHGCVRVQNPLELARHLLDEQGWSRSEIDSQIASGKRRVVSLKRPWPVYVTYLTAWVDADNVVQFRRDVYGRDKKLKAALRQ